ncbi:MAG: hypothetical protein M3442_14280 [Chloroflexota bacterium]|nr:hypothetical protein [Chloroflexota bacterium]
MSQFGPFLGCSGYPDCRYVHRSPGNLGRTPPQRAAWRSGIGSAASGAASPRPRGPVNGARSSPRSSSGGPAKRPLARPRPSPMTTNVVRASMSKPEKSKNEKSKPEKVGTRTSRNDGSRTDRRRSAAAGAQEGAGPSP